MKKALIFGGTTEGRKLAEMLASAKISVVYQVATEYGKETMEDMKYLDVRIGRLDASGMSKLFEEEQPDVIVDATHPFAEIVKKEIDSALFSHEDILFYRINRDQVQIDYSGCEFFDSARECAAALKKTEGTIFLTTGSKELAAFCEDDGVRERLVVRVIPSVESLEICNKNGLTGKQIIAMQGPFSTEMNLAQLRDSGAAIMVLKEGGKSSGEAERIKAARLSNVKCFIIKRPDEAVGSYAYDEVVAKLSELFDIKADSNQQTDIMYDICLAAFGMGFGTITEEVQERINEADVIFGAARMLSGIMAKGKKYPYYLAKDIIPVLEKMAATEMVKRKKIVILFSGDTSFYSGAKKMYKELSVHDGYKVSVLPGISSIAALAARCACSYDDAKIISTHGVAPEVWRPTLIDMALHSPKVFALTSGAKDARVIGELLMELEEKEEVKFEITAGFNLYSDEKVFTVDARKCAAINEDGLCVLLIKNKTPKARRLVPGLSDESFLRNSTPMSKEEIRALSICKLGVTKNACVYDVGSGSGSVAVELGLLDPSINVYAIEFKEAACSLIKENIAKFSVENVHLVEGIAPDAMEGLPSPTHVFIGGSGGQLETILAELRKFGSGIRVVVNAVTLETIAEVNTVLKSYAIEDADMVQVAVSKAKTVGSYSVMQAHNPVYIVSFTL